MGIEHITYAWDWKLTPELKLVLVCISSHMGMEFNYDRMVALVASKTDQQHEYINLMMCNLIKVGAIVPSPHFDDMFTVASPSEVN